MKKKFLIIGGFEKCFYVEHLTKQHLLDRKSKYYDHIINTEEGTEYNPDTNSWEVIQTIS